MPVMELLAKKTAWLWFGAVAVAVFLVYAPTLGHDFSLMDDAYFVTENPVVQGGLTLAGVKAAFTGVYASYWAPLLWLSFMVDQTVSGGAPWSFHLTNVVLFALSAGLLFLLAVSWTGGRLGVSLAAALLWALHPIRVESVAWITERKDVLSGIFFLLGLWCYTRARSRVASSVRRGVLLGFAWFSMLLGGMAKQVIFVMPAAFVLLDVWPLQRTSWDRLGRDLWRLIAEKWAFWLLTAIFLIVAYGTQSEGGAIMTIPLTLRLQMLPVHYLFYLEKTFWPTTLAPLQADLPPEIWRVTVGVVILIGLTGVLWELRKKSPWALWGWLWFVGLIFPLSGLIWAGSERVALRFLYLPHIGLSLALLMGLNAVAQRRPALHALVRGGVAVVLLFAAGATLRTQNYWRDPNAFGLWIYECHPEQGGACAMGGDTYLAGGAWDLALDAFAKGVAMQDRYCFIRQCSVWNQLGYPERTAQAWPEFERALGKSLAEFAPWERPTERELFWRVRGQALLALRDYPAAIAALREAVRWEPDPGAFTIAEYLRACHEAGHPEEASAAAAAMAKATGVDVREWRDLLPCYVELWKTGARGYAYRFFTAYTERFPDDSMPLSFLAWLLATAEPDGHDHARQEEWPQTALHWAEQALDQTQNPPASMWLTLATARANAGHFSEAVPAAEKARKLAKDNGDNALLEVIEKQIMNYRLGLAWRE